MTYDENDAAQYEYHLKDHLGNVRIAFADKDGDGYIEPFSVNPNEPNGGGDGATWNLTETEILQESHYYPFGMTMDGAWQDIVNGAENNYLYNGKELNTDFDLNWSDYGARWYDASIGRWNSVDPLAGMFPSQSPYNYTFNNPIRFIDPDGRAPEDIFIIVNATDKKNSGHAAVAVDEYNDDGEKTGNVVVYHLSPNGVEPDKGDIMNNTGVDASYTRTVQKKENFLKESKENYDGVLEVTSTKEQDLEATQSLDAIVNSNEDYNAVNNNCASLACKGLEPVMDTKKMGNETASMLLMTRTFKTPNSLFNDLKGKEGVKTIKDASKFTKTKFIDYVKEKLK